MTGCRKMNNTKLLRLETEICSLTSFCAVAKYCNKQFRVKNTFEFEGRIYATNQGISFSPRTGGAIRSIYAFHGLPSNRVYALAQQSDQLYAGTLGGLAQLKSLRVEKTNIGTTVAIGSLPDRVLSI